MRADVAGTPSAHSREPLGCRVFAAECDPSLRRLVFIEAEMFILIGSYFLVAPGGAGVTDGLRDGTVKPPFDAMGRSTWTGPRASATHLRFGAPGPRAGAVLTRPTPAATE